MLVLDEAHVAKDSKKLFDAMRSLSEKKIFNWEEQTVIEVRGELTVLLIVNDEGSGLPFSKPFTDRVEEIFYIKPDFDKLFWPVIKKFVDDLSLPFPFFDKEFLHSLYTILENRQILPDPVSFRGYYHLFSCLANLIRSRKAGKEPGPCAREKLFLQALDKKILSKQKGVSLAEFKKAFNFDYGR